MKRNKPRKISKQQFDALEAARTLDPKDLQRLLEEKAPPSPEEQQKNIITELMNKAKELPNEELSKMVQSRQAELRVLEILNLQRNMVGCQFNKEELDGFLQVLGKLPDQKRAELATEIQKAAVNAGLKDQESLNRLAQKLCRMGLHL